MVNSCRALDRGRRPVHFECLCNRDETGGIKVRRCSVRVSTRRLREWLHQLPLMAALLCNSMPLPGMINSRRANLHRRWKAPQPFAITHTHETVQMPPMLARDSDADGSNEIKDNSVRRRISRACDQCNQLRTKCNGETPCVHCIGTLYCSPGSAICLLILRRRIRPFL